MEQKLNARPSPFHRGEQEMQRRIGSRDYSEAQGQRSIRDFMPDQHRSFFSLLSYVFLSAVDADGWPIATMLHRSPGFISSPDPRLLHIGAQFVPEDPAAAALRVGSAVGVLGLDLATRRRNRMNGRIIEMSRVGFMIQVDQSFGNCPQYIQTRICSPFNISAQSRPAVVQRFPGLDDSMRAAVARADTFFVASVSGLPGDPAVHGADMSHRGGKPGFVGVDGNDLVIPDFKGNAFFNTLGNFLINPKAGLLFPDFSTGDLIYLAGTVQIVWDGAELRAWRGAERLWRVSISHGWRLKGMLPFRWAFQESAPSIHLTGSWPETKQVLEETGGREIYRSYRVESVVSETPLVRSIYLAPHDGRPRPAFKPGQFLPIRWTPAGRARPLNGVYTISASPFADQLRLSIKRGHNLSRQIHDQLKVGDVLEALDPHGDFYLDPYLDRPCAFISAGIGITPMISMLGYLLAEGKRTGQMRPTLFAHATPDATEQPFRTQLEDSARSAGGKLQLHFTLSRARSGAAAAQRFHQTGRLTAETLYPLLPGPDREIYLCGPPGFMQDLYDGFRALGIGDDRIHAEAFGPSSLRRGGEAVSESEETGAGDTEVVFARHGLRVAWNAASSNLLDFGIDRDVPLDSGCRRGACGTCAVRVLSGTVKYVQAPAISPVPGTALLCCARPAPSGLAGQSQLILDA
ncbi:2Fe-2S iron-sulfur cluster-binding protein [Taklimakanibacter deserti]|uniref:2Fe-2S iron-sulfur cluster-binding protein n=1 Tax=Taklimakanibacter deserti TaxID=2267839 RepID=UPI000E6571F3